MKNLFAGLGVASLIFVVPSAHADIAQGRACLNALESRPDLAIIANKIALSDPDKMTARMFADSSKPSKNEKEAILSWADEAMKCSEIINASLIPPPNNRV